MPPLRSNFLVNLILLVTVISCPTLTQATTSNNSLTTLSFSTLSRGSQQRDQISETIIRRAYEKLGIEIKVVPLPGQRSLSAANEGIVDGELRRNNIGKRDQNNLIRIPVAVNYLELCAFSNRHDLQITDKHQLQHYEVGTLRGGNISKSLGKLAKKTTTVGKLDQLLSMLKLERIELAIANCQITRDHLISNDIEGIHLYQPPIVRVAMYHYLHRKHQGISQEITDSLKEMEQSGELEAIRNGDPL